MSTQPQPSHDLSIPALVTRQSAAIIQEGDNYYYRHGPIVLQVSRLDVKRSRENPDLYYFPIALKLQQRAERVYELHQALIAQPGGVNRLPATAQLPYQYHIKAEDKRYDIVRLRIRQSLSDPHLRQQAPEPLDPEQEPDDFLASSGSNYWAEVIRNGPYYYYRIGNTIIDIEKEDYCRVLQNPILYYVSTALYLHRCIARINRVRESAQQLSLTDHQYNWSRQIK